LRHRSAIRETEQAGSHRHVPEFRSANRFSPDTQERAAEQEAALVDARDAASLREQFVAILAHDLRNPLASIDAGINVRLHRGPDEKTLREVGGHIRNSARRMAGLIDDMLDFAKGRWGGGFSLDRHPDAPLQEHLEQVIGELRNVSPRGQCHKAWHP
jgi:signal transduction histidine kinase